MAYSLLSRISIFLSLVAVLLLGGCCANNQCDCKDEPTADVLKLHFLVGADSLVGGSSFGRRDLDTIIIQRSPRPYKATTKPETVILIRTPAQALEDVVLNNNAPFGQVGTTKLNGYRYVIQYLAHVPQSKPVPTTVMVIDSVQLKGNLNGDGCCTCYTNSRKTVYALKPRHLTPTQSDVIVVDLKQKPYLELSK